MSKDSVIKLIITSRERDLGGFTVRRILPYATHRMVGPFIFFDHIGPAELADDRPVAVRPHPHINLATVTYLFEGIIHHRDSLGSDQLIEPGAVNWMTAGRGIVHSERTPKDHGSQSTRMHGIQCWVALPDDAEEVEPSFSHHPKDTLPEFDFEGASLKLLVGSAYGHESPVSVHSDLFYLDVHLPDGASFTLPNDGRESAIYVVQGEVTVAGHELGPCSMAVMSLGSGATSTGVKIKANMNSRLMLLGGHPVGPRHIFWNFVSSSKERIEAAKVEWRPGPRATSARFPPIPGDDQEFIPLPTDSGESPKGTIM